jgi:hypothetical protein
LEGNFCPAHFVASSGRPTLLSEKHTKFSVTVTKLELIFKYHFEIAVIFQYF